MMIFYVAVTGSMLLLQDLCGCYRIYVAVTGSIIIIIIIIITIYNAHSPP